MKLLIATLNRGKAQEIRALLATLRGEIVFPADIGLHINIAEEGATYLENAARKAHAYAQMTNLVTLADDSGLEVDALNGAPGVRSARYAPGDDQARIQALLHQMANVPWEHRTARFRCVVVIATPSGAQYVTEGTCEGFIAFRPAGTGGFGYDPIFYLPEYRCTMAELPQEVKNRISHRARAIQAALPILESLLQDER